MGANENELLLSNAKVQEKNCILIFLFEERERTSERERERERVRAKKASGVFLDSRGLSGLE